MTLAQKLIDLSKDMSEDTLSEVINFAECLKKIIIKSIES